MKSGNNNYQTIAPAIVLAVWSNEYHENINEELKVSSIDQQTGLNLKIFTDCGDDIKKTSVKHGVKKGCWCFEVELSKKELQAT